jgi:NitT/TauT family transport system ATP-binding protein
MDVREASSQNNHMTKITPSIELKNVSMTFRSGQRHTEALNKVSFSVAEKEFVTLIGPSGCGKTTVLKIIADIISPTEGQIIVNGKTPDEARKERLFGFVFQDPALLAWRTVIDNILLPLEVMRQKDDKDYAKELVELVGLAGFEEHFPDELSGGMQQRVSIARALCYNPSFLLMDEPFGALDLITREKMGQELLRIWENTEKTVIFVTHSIEEAVLLSDRILVMSPRPAEVLAEVWVDLPRPRDSDVRDNHEFLQLTTMLREMLV